MTLVVIILMFYTLVLVFDFIPQFRKKTKHKLFYIICFLATLTIDVLYELGIDIPSPATPIKNVVDAIFHLK